MRSPGEILERHKRLSEARRRLDSLLMKTLSPKALRESAQRLGMWEDGVTVFEQEEDIQLFGDAAMFDYFPAGGRNAVERFWANRRHELDTDAQLVLEAMKNARMTIVELRTLVPDVGFHAKDVLFDREVLLVDPALTELEGGPSFCVTRILEVDGFVWRRGVATSIQESVVETVAKVFGAQGLSGKKPESLTAKDRSKLGSLLFDLATRAPKGAIPSGG